MILAALPILVSGATQVYRAYKIAKFVKTAYNSVNENINKIENVENNESGFKLSKFINIGKSTIQSFISDNPSILNSVLEKKSKIMGINLTKFKNILVEDDGKLFLEKIKKINSLDDTIQTVVKFENKVKIKV